MFFPKTPAISTAPIADNRIDDYSNSKKLWISSSPSPDRNCSHTSSWTQDRKLAPSKTKFLRWGWGDKGIPRPRDHLATSADILLSQLQGRGCYWYQVGGGQGCHQTSYNAWGSPRKRERRDSSCQQDGEKLCTEVHTASICMDCLLTSIPASASSPSVSPGEPPLLLLPL